MKIMKLLLQIALFTFVISTFGQTNNPVVKKDASYEVLVDKDITYATGLSHKNINSNSAKEIPLMLDVYTPKNNIKNRPTIMLIHGGGFKGGTKEHKHIVKIAKYFTSRGWVAISINYRLQRHKGTVPQEWIDNAKKIAKERSRQFLAIYPAIRDAKAALRWVVANAKTYHINTNHITVGGGSAGAITAIALGISDQKDYKDEINKTQDKTLTTTNLDKTFQVKTILDFWGGKTGLDILKFLYNKDSFHVNNPSLFIAHGTKDPTVPFSKATELKTIYEKNGVSLAFYPLKEKGHGAWNATINNKKLENLAFDFIVEQQKLIIK